MLLTAVLGQTSLSAEPAYSVLVFGLCTAVSVHVSQNPSGNTEVIPFVHVPRRYRSGGDSLPLHNSTFSTGECYSMPTCNVQ